MDAVNYQELKICIPGKVCRESSKTLLCKFLEEPLVHKYGEACYREVEIAANHL